MSDHVSGVRQASFSAMASSLASILKGRESIHGLIASSTTDFVGTQVLNLANKTQLTTSHCMQAPISATKLNKTLAFFTDELVRSEKRALVSAASQDLNKMSATFNLYGYSLNRGGNCFFLVLFGMFFIFFSAMTIRSRYDWFNVCFVIGYALEFVGFLGRVLSFNNTSSISLYVLQMFCSTVAPAFIMTGVYFVFTQIVIIHGSRYSVLRPMWYPYIFITIYVVALVLQGVGGGIFGLSSSSNEYPRMANIVTFCGMLVQLLAMCVMFYFVIRFSCRVFFLEKSRVDGDFEYKNATVINFIKMLFNVRSARAYKDTQLEKFYNPRYHGIRLRRLVGYYPLAIFASVTFVFIRCVYRAVEVKQGYLGDLSRNEHFFLIFDSTFIALCGLIFIPFHPFFGFGKENVLAVINIKHDDETADSRKMTMQALNLRSDEPVFDKFKNQSSTLYIS